MAKWPCPIPSDSRMAPAAVDPCREAEHGLGQSQEKATSILSQSDKADFSRRRSQHAMPCVCGGGGGCKCCYLNTHSNLLSWPGLHPEFMAPPSCRPSPLPPFPPVTAHLARTPGGVLCVGAALPCQCPWVVHGP